MPPLFFKFESFKLDARSYELQRNGQKVTLQRLPMDLLIMLVERQGELVTRDEIASRFWKSDPLADTQSGTNTAVRKIRLALGDEGEKHRFVETVPGKGYRFIGEVSNGAPVDDDTGSIPADGDVRAGTAKPGRVIAPVVYLASAIVIGAIALFLIRPTRDAEPVEISPFTAFRGPASWPAFSPDGNQVAFGWTREEGANSHLYVKGLDSGSPVQLTVGPESDSSPSWSRDGRWIAFLRVFQEKEAHDGLALCVVRATGGEVRRIAALAGPVGYRPAWTPDGRGLVVMDSEPRDTPPSLFRVMADTGEKRRITTAEATGTGDWCPGFAPDGRSLAYLHNTGSRRVSPLYLLPVDSSGVAAGNPKRIETSPAGFVDFDWSADGHSLIAGAPSGLIQVPLSGGAVKPLPFPDGSQATVAVRGNRMVYLQPYRDTDIYRVPGPLGQGAAKKLISSTRQESAAQYSADGKEIVFVSDRSGPEEIWVTDNEGQSARKITSFGGPALGSPRWSPDGQSIAFDSTAGGRAGIYVIGVGGGSAQRITSGSVSGVRPSWSRDGKWIYFGSDQSGTWEIWKTAPRGGTPTQLTSHGGREAFEDPRGEFVYFTKASPLKGIWRIPSIGGEDAKVSDYGVQGRWAVGGSGVYYRKAADDFEFQEFSTTRRLPLVMSGLQLGERFGSLIAAAPDDHGLLVTVLVRSESHLTLVRNFR